MDLISEFMKSGPILQVPCGQKGVVPLAKALTPENFPLKKDVEKMLKTPVVTRANKRTGR